MLTIYIVENKLSQKDYANLIDLKIVEKMKKKKIKP